MTPSAKTDQDIKNKSILDISNLDLQQDVDRQSRLEKKVDDIVNRLKSCEKGVPKNGLNYPKLFEKICYDLLYLGLSTEFNNLHLKTQIDYRTALGQRIEITDIVLQNNGLLPGSIWNDLFYAYECQRIVFECKNLNDPITEDHIFQLYLYLGGAGKFGVILSRNDCSGYDTSKDGLSPKAFEALRRLHQDAKFMIWIWGENEIIEYLNHCKRGSVDKFFITQKALFHDKIK